MKIILVLDQRFGTLTKCERRALGVLAYRATHFLGPEANQYQMDVLSIIL